MGSSSFPFSAGVPFTSSCSLRIERPFERIACRSSDGPADIRSGTDVACHQCSQLLQTTMDIDLDERDGLAGCTGRTSNAETLQFDQADHAGLRGLQLAKEIVHRCSAYRRFPMILDG